MPGYITVSAYYYEQMDAVEVDVAAFDDNDEIYAPIDIKSVQVKLYKGESVLQQTEALDKFYGNDDFYYRVLFSRPSSVDQLEVEATAISRDGANTWVKRVAVTEGQKEEINDEVADNKSTIVE